MRRADGRVHVVLLQEFDRLVDIRRPVQQEPDGGRGREVGLVRFLVRLLVVSRHEVGDHEALFVHAVHGDVDRRERLDAFLHGAVGRVIVAEAEEIEVAGGERLVSVLRHSVHDDGAALLPVEIPAEIHAAFPILHADRGAAVVAGRDLHVLRLIIPAGEIPHEVAGQRGIAVRSALREEFVEPVVAAVHHDVQAVLKLLNAPGSHDERAELQPCAEHEQQDGRDEREDQDDRQTFLPRFSHGITSF